MIPLIQSEIADTKGWISTEDILDVVAIAESTPGPIAVNAATFVGYKVCGFWGAFLVTIGVVLPSFAVITVISFFLDKFENYKIVKYAFSGIHVGVLVLIVKALVSMYIKYKKSIFAYAVMIFAFAGTAFLNFNVLIAAAVVSVGKTAFFGSGFEFNVSLVCSFGILAITSYLAFGKKVRPIMIILISAVLGIAAGYIIN